jgi:hypothetical protein
MTPFMPGGAADGGLKIAASLDTSPSSGNVEAAPPVDNKTTVKAFGTFLSALVLQSLLTAV